MFFWQKGESKSEKQATDRPTDAYVMLMLFWIAGRKELPVSGRRKRKLHVRQKKRKQMLMCFFVRKDIWRSVSGTSFASRTGHRNLHEMREKRDSFTATANYAYYFQTLTGQTRRSNTTCVYVYGVFLPSTLSR